MAFGLSDLGKLLCTNFKTLFSILTAEALPDDLLLQFLQSTADFFLGAGKVWSYKSSVNRRLASINVSASPTITVEILKDNDVLAVFVGESGTLTLRNGIKINEYTIRTTNSGVEEAEWRYLLVFFG